MHANSHFILGAGPLWVSGSTLAPTARKREMLCERASCSLASETQHIGLAKRVPSTRGWLVVRESQSMYVTTYLSVYISIIPRGSIYISIIIWICYAVPHSHRHRQTRIYFYIVININIKYARVLHIWSHRFASDFVTHALMLFVNVYSYTHCRALPLVWSPSPVHFTT